jgi:protein-disulfide isomerase
MTKEEGVADRKAKAEGGAPGRQEGAAKAKRSPLGLVLGGVGVVAAAVIIWNVVSSAIDPTVRGPVDLGDPTPDELVALAQPIERGNAASPIIIVDFSDYSCPACRQFASQAKPLLDASYVDTGLARFQYFDFPIVTNFPNSFLAARAARCAGDQNAYWPFHDQLFRTQESWSRQADAAPSFEDFAGQLGLNRSDFRSCLRSDRHAATVTANLRLGQQLGVNATPTIFLNTGEGRARRVENWTNLNQVRALLDEAVERLGVQGTAPAAGATIGAAPDADPAPETEDEG